MTVHRAAPLADELFRVAPAAAPRHLVSVSALRRDDVQDIFERAAQVSRVDGDVGEPLRGRLLGVLFYQNSTRTRLSFEAAMHRLGGSAIGFDDVRTTRAGDFFQESLADTIGVVGQYTDGLVLRHSEDGAAAAAASVSPVPVLNGGDGANEHPTQALLDAWMMHRLLNGLDGARVGLVGDPSCRDFRSLIRLLQLLGAAEVLSVPSPGTGPASDQRREIHEGDLDWRVLHSVDELLVEADVISMLPVRLPSFHVGTAEPTDETVLDDRFRLTRAKLTAAPRRVPVLHVGPRGQELPPEVDGLDWVYYYSQVRAGMFLRAALLWMLMAP